MNEKNPARYRPCVGVMLVNADGKVFVGKRIDNQLADYWQMPQGGVDDGEDLEQAAFRELAEETGVRPGQVQLIDRLGDELYYDLPPELDGKLWGGRYKGQRQVWFLARFTGQDADIDLEAHDPPEFCEWRWADPAQLPDLIVPFKREVYAAILDAFRDRI
ncbi:RNA pyrophosphohydrolase [Altericroceibacterium xinjiangense]|uniref:RNA pyrophosphohydrolase n=1 Tax=Altericroceibacterium xinjiangense TaxID=762261 RepID=UPI000F7E1B3A|nr:RNA pyrophosphohydrolase [Altericroceibacterium xinjiangense]